jgi:MFS family permease
MQQAGRALLWCVAVFGLATIAFGLSHWFWFSFAMLALAGAVDNVSVVVRHTSVQLLTPDDKRGRVSSVNSLFISTSNELGGAESGFVAYWFGPLLFHVTNSPATSPAYIQAVATGTIISVVSGGIGTILVVIAVAYFWPEIRRYGKLA